MDFHGWPTLVLENQHLRLECLAQAGPRLVRLELAGQAGNLLAETPDIVWQTPQGPYRLFGGHRLWLAPEDPTNSYVPDSAGLVVRSRPTGLLLEQVTGRADGLQVGIELQLQSDRPAVTIHHYLHNCGDQTIQTAPWAITALPLGGVALLPTPNTRRNGSPWAPNRQAVFWPYTRCADPRLEWQDEGWLVRAQPALPPCKIGSFCRSGWIGYLRQGVLLRIRFRVYPESPHPDLGCNAEIYCNDRFVELETLGPLSSLRPGQQVVHTEEWEIICYQGEVTPKIWQELQVAS